MSIDLEPFRTAKTLTWHEHTVFEPNRGVDGVLAVDGGVHTLPLDIWTPDEVDDQNPGDRPTAPFSVGNHGSEEFTVGIVIASPATLAEARDAVRAWCEAQIGRSDVGFPQ